MNAKAVIADLARVIHNIFLVSILSFIADHVKEAIKIPFKHTLAFIAIALIPVSFFGSRLFATVCPTCIVVGSGIHFHHFSYGIGMVARPVGRDSGAKELTGWTGALRTCLWPRSGAHWDEVGLLLTFGNYYSELTYQIFVGQVGLIILGALGYSIRGETAKRFHANGAMGRSGLVGLFLAGFSTVFFAFDQTLSDHLSLC